MSKERYIGAVPNQPLIQNSHTEEEIANFFLSSGWFAEPSKLLDPLLAKILLASSPKPQENK
jgi:hypothetical protein